MIIQELIDAAEQEAAWYAKHARIRRGSDMCAAITPEEADDTAELLRALAEALRAITQGHQ